MGENEGGEPRFITVLRVALWHCSSNVFERRFEFASRDFYEVDNLSPSSYTETVLFDFHINSPRKKNDVFISVMRPLGRIYEGIGLHT